MKDSELKLLGKSSCSFFANKNFKNILNETFPLASYFRSVGDNELAMKAQVPLGS